MDEINWCAVGEAERQLLRDVIDFENEATRIDRTTYFDKNPQYLAACDSLRKAIHSYVVMLEAAGVPEQQGRAIGAGVN